MKITYFVLVAILLGVEAISDDVIQAEWKKFQLDHGKSYRSAKEHQTRFAIFKSNLIRIENHNELYKKGETSHEEGVNRFADWTDEEFKQYVKKGRVKAGSFNGELYQMKGISLPRSVDWRETGHVTPVKDQGDCGSCWTFSTTGALEGQLKKKTGVLKSLSEQNLVDCSRDGYNDGCDGGDMPPAFYYVMNHGIETEKDYPYKAREGRCKAVDSKVVTKLRKYVRIPPGNETAFQEALARIGPISVSVGMTNTIRFYKRGILKDADCSNNSEDLDHAVLTVGYGEEKGNKYYIVKNSWGPTYGEDGYIRIPRDKDNYCGLATDAVYPVL